jgi:hypothetical protein
MGIPINYTAFAKPIITDKKDVPLKFGHTKPPAPVEPAPLLAKKEDSDKITTSKMSILGAARDSTATPKPRASNKLTGPRGLSDEPETKKKKLKSTFGEM